MTRDQRQSEIIDKWKKAGCKASVEACTGFGKTRTAIKALKRMRSAGYNVSALVVVPTNYLETQWKERLKKFGLKRVDVKTVQSIIRDYSGDSPIGKWNVLIPDEIHKYVAEEFGKLYNAVEYDAVLGLTATVPDDERADIIEKYAPVVDRVTVTEAKENDWVSDFVIYQYGVQLNHQEQDQYDALTDKFYKNFSWFSHDWPKVTKCLNDDKFCARWAAKQGIHGQTGRLKGHASRVMSTVQDRKSLLYQSETKLDVAEKILQRFPDKLTIAFSERTSFADALADRFPDRAFAYHSNIEGQEVDGEYYGVERMKERGIDLFSDPSSEVNILSTARALDMGVDIENMDLGIITSASSKSLQAIQRIGRVIRHQENKTAIIVDIFAEDTQDEFWLQGRYKDFPDSLIKRISTINEIDHL